MSVHPSVRPFASIYILALLGSLGPRSCVHPFLSDNVFQSKYISSGAPFAMGSKSDFGNGSKFETLGAAWT